MNSYLNQKYAGFVEYMNMKITNSGIPSNICVELKELSYDTKEAPNGKKCEICDETKFDFLKCRCKYLTCTDCLTEMLNNDIPFDCPFCRMGIILHTDIDICAKY